MKNKIIKLMLGFGLLIPIFAFADVTSIVYINTSLKVAPGVVTIYAPSYLDFGTHSPSNSTKAIVIDLLTYGGGSLYFSVEDLAGTDLGYHTTMSMGNLTSSTCPSCIIPAKNISLTLSGVNSGITVLDGLACNSSGCSGGYQIKPPEIIIPNVSNYTKLPLNPEITVVQRSLPTTPDSGILGTYGVQPSIEILLPPYITLGSYYGLMTYTVIEH